MDTVSIFTPHHGYRIIPHEMFTSGTGWVQGDSVYISAQDVYKYIFINNVVDDERLKMACDYAKNKLAQFIDRIALQYAQ
jgi:hypothetical protein